LKVTSIIFDPYVAKLQAGNCRSYFRAKMDYEDNIRREPDF